MMQIFIIFLSLFFTHTARADYSIDKNNSVVAVVIYKDGPLSYMTTNHFVFATRYSETIFSGSSFEELEATIEFPTEALSPNLNSVTRLWLPNLRKFGLSTQDFKEVSSNDRESIYSAMMGSSQLDAHKYRTISAQLLRLVKKPFSDKDYWAKVAMTIHGVTKINKRISAKVRRDGNRSYLELCGPFNFTDFGISPFAAMGGAIHNDNTFYIYGHFALVED